MCAAPDHPKVSGQAGFSERTQKDRVLKCLIVDTEHPVKDAQRPQHMPRAPLALLSEHCTRVVGGARDMNGVEMWRG